MSSLGQSIRALRMQRNMTQQTLCENLVTPSMISQIESDKATPSIQLLEQLAERLGVHPDYFSEFMAHKTDLTHTYRRARTMMDSEQYFEAIRLLESLLNPLTPQFREELLCNDLAQCYEHIAMPKQASLMYDRVVRVALEKEDVPTAVYAHYYNGHVHRKLNQFAMARMYWQRAMELLRRHPEVTMPLAMKIQANLGRMYFVLQQFDLALESYQMAAERAERFNATLDLAMIQHGVANVYIEKKQYVEARAYTDVALQLYDAIRHQRGVNQCKINIGIIFSRQGKHEEAVQYFAQCMLDPEIQTDTLRYANALGERAISLVALKRFDEALSDGLRALQLDRESPTWQSNLWLLMSQAYVANSQMKEALDCTQHALAQAAKVDDIPLTTRVYRAISEVHRAAGETASAVVSALEIANRAVSPVGVSA